VRLLFGERSIVEFDVISVEEVGLDVGWLVGVTGIFRIAGDVDTAQNHLAPNAVDKLAILYSEAKRAHGSKLRNRVAVELPIGDSGVPASRKGEVNGFISQLV